MTGEEFLAKLRTEASDYGFHAPLRAWVDDHSEAARVLRAFDEAREEES